MNRLKRVLVTGGRSYGNRKTEREHIWANLDCIYRELGVVVIIHGDCETGADKQAGVWAERNECPCIAHPARWRATNSKSAGPIRNQAMLDEWKPDMVLAFPGYKGTADMIRRAKRAKIELIETGYHGDQR